MIILPAVRNLLKEWQLKHGLKADGVPGPLTIAALMAFLGIANRLDCIALMAQIQHETLGFRKYRESMNYTPAGILETYNSKSIQRFSKLEAGYYGRTNQHPANQEMIANIAYANRSGNGTVESGDGWRYRGGGGLHTTFKNNYLKYFDYAGLPPDTDPDILGDPEHFFTSAKFWFDDNRAWRYSRDFSKEGIKKLSNLVNAGNANRKQDPNGLDERIQLAQAMAQFFNA